MSVQALRVSAHQKIMFGRYNFSIFKYFDLNMLIIRSVTRDFLLKWARSKRIEATEFTKSSGRSLDS